VPVSRHRVLAVLVGASLTVGLVAAAGTREGNFERVLLREGTTFGRQPFPEVMAQKYHTLRLALGQ